MPWQRMRSGPSQWEDKVIASIEDHAIIDKILNHLQAKGA
jgi:hypothetical protein